MDTYGFCVQVAGQYHDNVEKGFLYGPEDPSGKYAYFWTPHYDAVTYPYNPGGVSTSLTNYRYQEDFGRGSGLSKGYSVRCLQD